MSIGAMPVEQFIPASKPTKNLLSSGRSGKTGWPKMSELVHRPHYRKGRRELREVLFADIRFSRPTL
jgi:hypothetical protein